MKSATQVTVSTFGVMMALTGIEHGMGEILQGNTAFRVGQSRGRTDARVAAEIRGVNEEALFRQGFLLVVG